jgi:pimeloyl-ACP methyl ester carboxylesterase
MERLEDRGQVPPKGFRRYEYLVNGIKTVVHVAGQGRPVVYFHGAGTWTGLDFARPWAERFKVIAPMHPGWGESGDEPQLDDIHEYVLHYLDLFDQLKVSPFDLVGFSLGGWLAAEFAVVNPRKVRKLVLVAPAGLLDPEHPGPPMGSWTLEEMYSYLVSDLETLRPYLPRNEAEKAAHAADIERSLKSAMRIASKGPFNPNLGRWLHRLTMPTLLVWSKADRLVPAERAKRWMSLLPNAQLALFENAGHLVLDELKEARECVAKFLA